jgi:hypothetical protein
MFMYTSVRILKLFIDDELLKVDACLPSGWNIHSLVDESKYKTTDECPSKQREFENELNHF